MFQGDLENKIVTEQCLCVNESGRLYSICIVPWSAPIMLIRQLSLFYILIRNNEIS